ncbi:hypothetical protein Tco_1482060 [Tanacetum coccineum]
MSAKDTIAVHRCGLSAKELNEFLSSYPIPSEYDVILPTSTQTIFDAPPDYVGLYTHSFSLANLRLPLTDFFCEVLQYFKVHIYRLNPFGCGKLTTFIIMCKAYGCEPSVDLFREMDFKNFIYTKDDDDLAFLLKEPSPGFGIGSPSALVNTEPPKYVDEPKVQPAEVTADSGESSKAGVFVVHRGSVVASIKERKCKTRGGSSRPPVKRKLASESSSSRAVRAKTSASKDDAPFLSISDDDEGPPDCFELKDANVCHLKISSITPPAWRVYFDNQMDLELPDLHDRCYARQDVVDNIVNRRASAMAEFDQNPAVLALQEKISSLTADDKEHKEIEELNQDRRDVVSKVVPYAAIELVHSDELGRLVGKLVSSAITYGRCIAYDYVAKKLPFTESCSHSRTHMHMPSSQKATPSSAPSVNLITPHADLSKPSPPPLE